jgi:hypothetical protein
MSPLFGGRGQAKNFFRGDVVRPWGKRMAVMAFEVCRNGRDERWIVRLGNRVYGFYLDRETALLDAVDAARDALLSGRDAQVWVRDSASASRIL